MSRRNAAKKAVFFFCFLYQYFGLHMAYPTVVTLNMNRYNTKTQKKICENGFEARK